MSNIYTPEMTLAEFAHAISGNGTKNYTRALYLVCRAHYTTCPKPCRCPHPVLIRWYADNATKYEKLSGWGPKSTEALKTLDLLGPEKWAALCEGTYWGRTNRIMRQPPRKRR